MALPVINLNEFLYNQRLRRADSNNNVILGSFTKKCLFGAPDSKDLKVLLEQQHEADRERFLKRYNVDIVNHVDPLDIENVEPRKDAKVVRSQRKLRLALKPYNNQMRITDFAPSKKSSQPPTAK